MENMKIYLEVTYLTASPPLTWGSAQRLGKSKQVNLHPTSTRYNSTNIAAMEAALALIKSLDKGEHFTYTNVAKFYKVD
jgi:hypothetical protein